MKGNIPYFIDFGQAVVTRHPNAILFLQRDIKNILNYFRKNYCIEKDYSKVYGYVTG
jgi:RIO kinase 1